MGLCEGKGKKKKGKNDNKQAHGCIVRWFTYWQVDQI